MVSGVKHSANQYSYVKGHRGILHRVSWLVVLNHSANQYSYVKGHRGILHRVSWLVVLNTQPTSTVMSKVIEAYYTGLVG